MKSTLAIITALAISTVFAQNEQTPPPQPPPQEQYQYSPPQPQYQPPQQQATYTEQQTQTQHFTNGQRFATMALNIVPGLGSALIMNDYLGAGVQLYLTALGITFISWEGGIIDMEKECLGYNTNTGNNNATCNMYGDNYLKYPGLVYIGAGLLAANAAFNIFRSMLYNEPTSKSASHATANQPSGFNLSVLPNSKGEVMPYVMYNRSF